MENQAPTLERQLLDKLLAERADLDQHIALLQKRLGLEGTSSPPQAMTVPLDSLNVQKGEFYGMSRPQAAAALLRKAKQTLTTNQIFDRLRETGYDGLSGKNAFNGLYTALSRASEVTKVAPNTWGLREWYPHLKEPKKRVPITPENLPDALPLNESDIK